MRRNGFTVFELLVVVAIVSLLASILIPELLFARRRASDSVAKAFLHEVATLQGVYKVDNGAYSDAFADLIQDPSTYERFSVLIDEAIIGANAESFCVTVQHPAGTGFFYVTDRSGVEDGDCS